MEKGRSGLLVVPGQKQEMKYRRDTRKSYYWNMLLNWAGAVFSCYDEDATKAVLQVVRQD